MARLQYYFVWYDVKGIYWEDVVSSLWIEKHESEYHGLLQKRKAKDKELMSKIKHDMVLMEIDDMEKNKSKRRRWYQW